MQDPDPKWHFMAFWQSLLRNQIRFFRFYPIFRLFPTFRLSNSTTLVQNPQLASSSDRKKTLPHLWGSQSHRQLDDKNSEPKKNSEIIYIFGPSTSGLHDLSSKRTRAEIHWRSKEIQGATKSSSKEKIKWKWGALYIVCIRTSVSCLRELSRRQACNPSSAPTPPRSLFLQFIFPILLLTPR